MCESARARGRLQSQFAVLTRLQMILGEWHLAPPSRFDGFLHATNRVHRVANPGGMSTHPPSSHPKIASRSQNRRGNRWLRRAGIMHHVREAHLRTSKIACLWHRMPKVCATIPQVPQETATHSGEICSCTLSCVRLVCDTYGCGLRLCPVCRNRHAYLHTRTHAHTHTNGNCKIPA